MKTNEVARDTVFELQQDVIGGILTVAELQPSEFAELVERVRQAGIAWKAPLHAVWTQIEQFAAQNLVPNAQALYTNIQSAGDNHYAGGLQWIISLYERTPSTAHMLHALQHLCEIQERARLKKLLATGIERANDGESLSSIIESLRDTLSEIEYMRMPRSGWRADELMRHQFPPPKWIIPDLLPAGITLFAGKPKIGKSWLALQVAHSVAVGGFAMGKWIERGTVLYLALEDTPRRLQQRMHIILDSTANRTPSDSLYFYTNWSRMHEGGNDELRNWITQNPAVRLIVIDTFAKIRPPIGRNEQLYSSDYASMDLLHDIAREHEIAILVLHHTRKAAADDIIDTVSGTTGLTGSVDSIWVLERGRQESNGRLFITGRDVIESDLAISFDSEFCTWQIRGDHCTIRRTEERRNILQALAESKMSSLTPREISELLEISHVAVRQALSRAERDGDCERTARGQYRITAQGLQALQNNQNVQNIESEDSEYDESDEFEHELSFDDM